MSFNGYTDDTYIIPSCLDDKTTAIIYTRVSTKQQVRGSGLSRQREGCAEFARRAGLVVVAVHEDAGVSGDLYVGRPALQAALCDLERGMAQVFIVEDFDRLSRNREHMNTIVDRIENAGAIIIISEAQRVDSPTYNQLQGIGQLLQEHKQAVLEGRA